MPLFTFSFIGDNPPYPITEGQICQPHILDPQVYPTIQHAIHTCVQSDTTKTWLVLLTVEAPFKPEQVREDIWNFLPYKYQPRLPITRSHTLAVLKFLTDTNSPVKLTSLSFEEQCKQWEKSLIGSDPLSEFTIVNVEQIASSDNSLGHIPIIEVDITSARLVVRALILSLRLRKKHGAIVLRHRKPDAQPASSKEEFDLASDIIFKSKIDPRYNQTTDPDMEEISGYQWMRHLDDTSDSKDHWNHLPSKEQTEDQVSTQDELVVNENRSDGVYILSLGSFHDWKSRNATQPLTPSTLWTYYNPFINPDGPLVDTYRWELDFHGMQSLLSEEAIHLLHRIPYDLRYMGNAGTSSTMLIPYMGGFGGS
jgi:hypothetical protein